MNPGAYKAWITLLFMSVVPSCNGQMKKNNNLNILPDRYPAVAGSFYPGQANQLGKSLKNAFSAAVP